MDSIGQSSGNPDEWLEQCFDVAQNVDEYAKCDDVSAYEKAHKLHTKCHSRSSYERERHLRGTKPHSTPLTLKWLQENYERCDGVCIPRSTLYVHYVDFCQRVHSQPINAASFGKIIRQQFPQLTTRRLGTRGQSKYHYYGIGVRETSVYYDVIYSSKGIEKNAEYRKECSKQSISYSPKSKLGTLLPNFPNIDDLSLSTTLPRDKVDTFMVMYRAHCQRILDAIISANFDEVENFLVHFWQGIPPHVATVLSSETVARLVGVCDGVLYRTVMSVLMPAVLQPLPDSLAKVIRKFAKKLDDWLRTALNGLPPMLCDVKYDQARRFTQMLRRQTSLNHLCVAAGSVLYNPDAVTQMLADWRRIDLNSIVKQTLYTMDRYSERDHGVILELCGEFEKLLDSNSPIDSYTEWLESLVRRCVCQLRGHQQSVRHVARQFLLIWTCFCTRIIRDMTLYSAPSFGSFHLLHLMFDDYIMYLIEAIYTQEKSTQLLLSIRDGESGTQPTASSGKSCMLESRSTVEERTSVIISTSNYGHRKSDSCCLPLDSSSPTASAFSPVICPTFPTNDIFTDKSDCAYAQAMTSGQTFATSSPPNTEYPQPISPVTTSSPPLHYTNSSPCRYENTPRQTQYMTKVDPAWNLSDDEKLSAISPTSAAHLSPYHNRLYSRYNYVSSHHTVDTHGGTHGDTHGGAHGDAHGDTHGGAHGGAHIVGRCDTQSTSLTQYPQRDTAFRVHHSLYPESSTTTQCVDNNDISSTKRKLCFPGNDYNENVVKCSKYAAKEFADCMQNSYVC